MSRNRMLVCSLLPAAVSFLTRWTIPLGSNPAHFVLVSALFAFLWMGILAIALQHHGSGALWLVVGAPLAFYWPILFTWVLYACTYGSAECS